MNSAKQSNPLSYANLQRPRLSGGTLFIEGVAVRYPAQGKN
jgi:hypothetical protein